MRRVCRVVLPVLSAAGAWHCSKDRVDWQDPKNCLLAAAAVYFAQRFAVGFRKPLLTDCVEYDADTKPGTTGVLLVNLGTPEGVDTSAVRRFLREFLSDERVIDAPPHCRWMLVNLIIAPFRASGSAAMYRRIWDTSLEDSNLGSPIMRYGVELLNGVRNSLGRSDAGKFHVELAMRYQSPSLEDALMRLKRKCVEHIIVVPLFPQYSSSCTGSIHQKVFDILSSWDRIPNLTFNSTLLGMKGFVETFEQTSAALMKEEYDHYVFSYHGVPVKQITKGSLECKPDSCPKTGCCSKLTERNRLCYKASCHETSRRIAKAVGIPEEKYTVTFQSRLGPTKWLQPYTDEKFGEFAESDDKKRVLVFSPAFVADCLETIDEIGSELRHEFLEKGGTKMDLVPSLNANDIFVQGIADLVCTTPLRSPYCFVFPTLFDSF